MKHGLHLRLQIHLGYRLSDPVGYGRYSEHPDPLPPAFGISTAFTGGGKYEPDDIRFHIRYRFLFRS